MIIKPTLTDLSYKKSSTSQFFCQIAAYLTYIINPFRLYFQGSVLND